MNEKSYDSRYWDKIGLQCQSLLLQCNELIHIGVESMGPHQENQLDFIKLHKAIGITNEN